MNTHTPEFDAIDLLTRQSDNRGLCDSILAALNDFAHGVEATLLEVYDVRGQLTSQEPSLEHLVVRHYPTFEKLDHPLWLPSALEELPENDQFRHFRQAGRDVICTRQLAGVIRVIEVSGATNEEMSRSILRVVGVFANLLRLFDRFERDPLTGLLNRQSFDERFEDLLEYHQHNPNRRQTNDTPWLAITDIDHFKKVNDTYGHLFGDEILLLVSRIMKQCFRFDDLLFRYGGEEFIIILNNTNATGAELALERFRRSIQSYVFPRLGEMTVSTGWAGIGARELSIDVIHKADKALYYAKEHGRNQVVSFDAVFGGDATAGLR